MTELFKKMTIGLLVLFTSLQVGAQTVSPDFVDGRIYVKVLASSVMDLETYNNSNALLNQMIIDYDIQSMEHAFKSTGAMQKVYRIEFTDINDVDNLVSDFSTLPFIEYAEKAPLYHLQFTPNDLNTSTQYALDVINAESAWDIERGDANVVIAIVDNGVNINHEDLNRWENSAEIANNGMDDDLNGYTDDKYGYDAADRDGDPTPPAGGAAAFVHGSHCAGISSANTDNATGIASIGYNVSIMSVKATRDDTDGNSLSAAFEGVDYALTAGADIVSMSFGSSSTLLTWDVIINQAQSQGVLLVAAAGNDNSSDLQYPAAYPYVMSVGATDQNDARASFSNYGETIDLMAPGQGILSLFFQSNSSYGTLSGTSMATPMVAGLAGLVLSYDSSLSVQELKDILTGGCDNIDAQNPGFEDGIGAGRINAFKSIQLAAGLTLEEINTDDFSFVLYPNPTEGNVFLMPEQTLPKASTVEIFDLNGQLVHEQSFGLTFEGAKLRLNTDKLETGVYLVNFIIDDFQQMKRFVKL